MSSYALASPFMAGLVQLGHRLAAERRAENLRRISRVAAAARRAGRAEAAERSSTEGAPGAPLGVSVIASPE